MSKKKTHKKIYLEDFPKHKTGKFVGCIDWKNLDNNTIRFEYQDMVGTFLVKYFDKDTEKILVKYNNREIWCHRSTFRRNNICRIIGIIDNDFRYEIGHRYITDNFDFTITDKKVINNKKMYKYKCNKCGFDSNKTTYYKGNSVDYWVSETNLKQNISCPCCGGKKTYTQEGINDITTTDR